MARHQKIKHHSRIQNRCHPCRGKSVASEQSNVEWKTGSHHPFMFGFVHVKKAQSHQVFACLVQSAEDNGSQSLVFLGLKLRGIAQEKLLLPVILIVLWSE